MTRVVAFLLLIQPAFAADAPQNIVTACTPDAIKLCSSLLSSPHDKIGACLNAQYDKLSPACKFFFKKR